MRARRTWAQVAVDLDMSLDDGGWFGRPRILGRREVLSITIEPSRGVGWRRLADQ